ncbi:HoxN/HupN/NixA family nickel/cobalt transporter [Citrobacter amalonaticus]|uniref:Nickel/cobalt efflux system n=1 Tax=Citrobacter amalonaticus TaxID=35703 RepID=A0A2S4RRF4_CITAM|nr:HoxN/HupN/NixA family nickel/cobalt transporter [Citrobacter amalonaticus]POT58596.1 HoxN/HupN/NixA family nickel/cobalt transporter [Citrobacter amalonaticus]POT70334.1 HoxN/HupN/NixA family nickel/cobalt transporter [Citrobacter amalonaticus]POU61318.1 HoxN/HupN/NixA family nickel/cobalt transporter [Citrobacter amalonaticus]POV05113.1 HoxN/HupN/NixA family nickel/cobalt transporter [Citrobacter amalonaticus]
MNITKFFTPTQTLLLCLIIINLLSWCWAFIAFKDNTFLMGMAILAYSFGLRHAVDADHIVAIDNVTRKLMQQGQRPIAVGTFFSLGHSTIVVLASVVIAITAMTYSASLEKFRETGGLIGTTVSTLFLLVFAFLNYTIFLSIYKKFRTIHIKGSFSQREVQENVNQGILSRLFRRLFTLINKSQQMYWVGLLFGLGFDTATEIGVLSISAITATNGMNVWSTLVFPVLFASAMVLVDTLDNYLMTGVYGWAFSKPLKKLYYNMTITGISAFIAIFIGSVQALGLLGEKMNLSGWLWNGIANLSDNLADMGFWIIGVFIVCWLCSVGYYWFMGYDKLPSTDS